MKEKRLLLTGLALILIFILWTLLIQNVDIQPVGPNGTTIGFASLNCWFYKSTGVHMILYYITDWLGLVPVFCCLLFGTIGFIQLVKRKSLFKVDADIIILGIYYITVIIIYLIFETFPINYRPILIDEIMEASYPSSTTLLVLSVMLTVYFQAERRIKSTFIKKTITVLVIIFSVLMVIGRTLAGVHWLTDIIGSIILSEGLYLIYQSSILFLDNKWRIYRGI